MATLTLELRSQKRQTDFNLERWAELLADRELAKVEGRIETDRHGHIVMTPPPAPGHGNRQSIVSHLLWDLMPNGSVFTECPISTADGIKAADAAWASPESIRELGDGPCFSRSPEICVEVVSPRNSRTEITEKVALYFDAGAKEVWLCAQDGTMTFFIEPNVRTARSRICPAFPKKIPNLR